MKHFKQIIDLLENASHYYIICTNMAGNYSYVNNTYAARFRHVDDALVGKPFHITMHPDDIPACMAAGQTCLENKDILAPATIRKHDGAGGYIITQWEFKGMFDDNGNPEGVFCLGYDITDFKKQLAKKDDILDAIAFSQSHVVRRPVANILGVADLLKEFEFAEDVKELVDILLVNTQQLDEVIRKVASDIHS